MVGVSDMAYVERTTRIYGIEAEYLGMQYGLSMYRTATDGIVNVYGVSHSKSGDNIMTHVKLDFERNVTVVDLGD